MKKLNVLSELHFRDIIREEICREYGYGLSERTMLRLEEGIFDSVKNAAGKIKAAVTGAKPAAPAPGAAPSGTPGGGYQANLKRETDAMADRRSPAAGAAAIKKLIDLYKAMEMSSAEAGQQAGRLGTDGHIDQAFSDDIKEKGTDPIYNGIQHMKNSLENKLKEKSSATPAAPVAERITRKVIHKLLEKNARTIRSSKHY